MSFEYATDAIENRPSQPYGYEELNARNNNFEQERALIHHPGHHHGLPCVPLLHAPTH
jgi:hypothetical protein